MNETDPLASLRAALAAREEAPRAAPVRVHNRLMKAVEKQCDVLARTDEGRAALATAAASDQDALLRLMAATTIQRWDVAAARAALEDLVRLAGGTIVRPMTMTAALTVPGVPGGTAALCLFNLDIPRPQSPPAPTPTVSTAPVASSLLDAAERVYNLAMNGGIDHAYEAAGDQFAAAAEACEAIGATTEADVLRSVTALLASHDDGDRVSRAAALAALTDEQDDALQALNDRFCSVDDLMERLEAADEA